MELTILIINITSASKRSILRFVITEKAPTRAFSWLKAATTDFTFKILCYTDIDPTASQHEIGSATQRSYGTGGLVSIVSYSCQSLMIIELITNLRMDLF